jgi:hypothetical protein
MSVGMPDVPNEYRVVLSNFSEHDLGGAFCHFTLDNPLAKGHGVFRVYKLDDERFAIEIFSRDGEGGDFSRFLTQAEVDSIHFGVRSDGIKELRVGLPSIENSSGQ